jgi:hypothetical protein
VAGDLDGVASTVTYFAHPRLVWLPLLDAAPNELPLVWPRHSTHPYLNLLLQETRRATVPSSSEHQA